MIEILRAWDYGKNKIRYVTLNRETNRTILQDLDFEWWFYVRSSDIAKQKDFFKRLKEECLVNKYEPEGKYTRVYVDREHESEFLDKTCTPSWMFKDKKLNYILKLLDERNMPHFEADLSITQRWLTSSDDVKYIDDVKVLFWDIETDDKHITGKPVPGEFQILSIAAVDGQTGKSAWICAADYGDEAEKEMLVKFAKLMNSYDVFVAYNGSAFDVPYLKARFARYGIEIDFRKKFFQDHLQIIKKHGVQLPSYKLENVAQYYIKRGKVQHDQKIHQMFENNRPLLREYNIEDCMLMFDIEHQNHLLAVARMVNSSGFCPCDDIYISRKIDILVLRQAYKDKHYHFRTKVRKPEEDSGDDEQFIGAYVVEPETGLHRDVEVFDFSSLYPSVMRTFNISPDTIINSENESEVPDGEFIKHPRGNRFRRDFVGIIPAIITMIQENRAYYKGLKKKAKPNTVEHATYSRLEYVWKAYGLSFYGCIGNKFARFYNKDVAECVTLGGQWFIKRVMEYLTSIGIKVIYGDTDSAFIKSPRKLKMEEIEIILKNINKICRHHSIKDFNCKDSYLEMAFDKGFTKIIIVSKKRYAGNLWFVDDKILDKPEFYAAGLEFKRTDQCALLKRKQKELIERLLAENEMTYLEAKGFLTDLKRYIFGDNVSLDDIKFSQSLSKEIDEYKSETMHLKVVDEMRNDGKEVFVSDKIEYFVELVDHNDKPIPRPTYKFRGKFAREYMWNNKISEALLRILRVVYPKGNWEDQDIKTKHGASLGRMGLW